MSTTYAAPQTHARPRTFQPWIILRKDLVHIWVDVVVSLGLLIAFAWTSTAAAQNAAQMAGEFNPWALAAGIVRFLIPVSWLVLISRLVHDEELVGDRQFWITRPYTWYFLLLSKVMFVVLFIALPFVLMQAWMLHHAGLYPLYSLKGMFSTLGSLGMLFLLPFFAIAAVTMTFIRYISSVLAGFLYALVVAGVSFWLFEEKLQAPGLDWIVTAFILLLPLAAVFVQYARRRTAIARILLLATPLVFLILGLVVPAGTLINHHYSPNNALGTATFDNEVKRQEPEGGRLFTFHGKVLIHLPVSFALTSVPQDSFLEAPFLRVTVDGTNGVHYDSGWMAENQRMGTGETALSFRMPQKVVESLHGQPAHLHLDFAGETWKPGTPWTVTATEKPFALPDHANCVLDPTDGSLECQHAYRFVTMNRISAPAHAGNCLQPGPARGTAHGMVPMDSGMFNPVATSHVQLMSGAGPAEVCSGTPVTFTPYVEGSNGQLHLDIPAINLDDYTTHLQVHDQEK